MKNRNIMAVIFLSIITLGIYDLYWLVSTKKVLNQATDVKIPSIWLLFSPVLILVVATVAILLLSRTFSDSAIASVLTAVAYLVGLLGVLPITFYWFLKYSKAVNHYTNGEINTAMSFILLWVLRFVGIAVIQDKFNDMVSSSSSVAAPVASFTPNTNEASVVSATPVDSPTQPNPAPADDIVPAEQASVVPTYPPETPAGPTPAQPTDTSEEKPPTKPTV